MTTAAVFFPFDLFGSSGTSAGAELLADAFAEMLADNRRERVPTRARAYADQVQMRRLSFETMSAYQDWRKRGRQALRQAWRDGAFLLWVTGNHLGLLPVYEELARCARDTLVIQLDAHLDIHHFAECTPELSHGNFLLHCPATLPAIINLGHRDLLLPPDYVAKYFRLAISAEALALEPDAAVKQIATLAAAKRVFVDIDCDVFDPAFFPAVREPLPFGLSPHLLLRLLDAVWSERVIGVAISEFDPARDRRDSSLATLVWFLEYVLLRRHESVTSSTRAAAPRSDRAEMPSTRGKSRRTGRHR